MGRRWASGAFVGATLGLGSIVSAAAGSAPVPSSTNAPVVLAQATVARSTFYTTVQASLLTTSGTPFTFGNAYWMHYGDAPASLTMDYAKPQSVALLINTSYTDGGFAGQTAGTVHLTFSDGSSQDTALVVGANIREWENGASWTANTLSSSSTVSVWQGQAQAAMGGAAATIDMLTIPVTSAAHLTGVTVTETNNSHMGIVFQGLTVTYNPITRPGNSGNTPAADNSQAPNHSNSKNFTGVKPAAAPEAALKSTADTDTSDSKTTPEKTKSHGHHGHHGEE